MSEMLIVPASILALVAGCVLIAYLSNYVGKVSANRVMEADQHRPRKKGGRI